MKTPLAVLATLVFVFASACSSSKSSDATPTPRASAPRTQASPATQPAGTPAPRTRLAPDNLQDLRVGTEGSLANLEGVAWSDDSLRLVVYNRQSIAAIENKLLGETKQLASVSEPESIMDVAPSGTGSFVSRIDDTHFNLRSLNGGSVIKAVQTEAPFSNVVLSHDGRMAAVQRQDKIAADLYQLPGGTVVKQLAGFETAAPVYSVRFSPDGRSLVWLSRALMQVQEIATGNLGPQIRHEDFVSSLALRPSGSVLATATGQSVSLWDLTSGASQQTLAQDGTVSGVAFSPDSSLLAVTSNAGLTLWDARAAAYTKLTTLPGAFRQVAFAPDGTAIATTDQNGQAAIWGRLSPTK